MAIQRAQHALINGGSKSPEVLMDPQKIRDLCLTPAEIRTAKALFRGRSVVDHAKEAAISLNTARWHVKHIYAKADVHRQSELIYRLLKGSSGRT